MLVKGATGGIKYKCIDILMYYQEELSERKFPWCLVWWSQNNLAKRETCLPRAPCHDRSSWWRHEIEIFSALLAFCAGNSLVTGEFPSQRQVTRSFDSFVDLRLNKGLSIQSRLWWLETPSRSLWLHCNVFFLIWIQTGIWFIFDNFFGSLSALFLNYANRHESYAPS